MFEAFTQQIIIFFTKFVLVARPGYKSKVFCHQCLAGKVDYIRQRHIALNLMVLKRVSKDKQLFFTSPLQRMKKCFFR